MEGSKRRRSNSNSSSATGDDVTDAEVEEFYAILRRIFVVASTSKHRRLLQSPPATWCPSFAPEDFQVPARSRTRSRRDDLPVAVAEGQRAHGAPAVRRLLDLNEDPEPDDVSGPTPTAG